MNEAIKVELDGDNYEEALKFLRDKSPFTEGKPLDKYIKGIRRRFGMLHDEILPSDPKELLLRLEEMQVVSLVRRG